MIKPVIRLKPFVVAELAAANLASASFINYPWKSAFNGNFASNQTQIMIEIAAEKIFGPDNVKHWKELSKRKAK